MQKSASVNLIFNQGADFQKTFYLKSLDNPVNITGYLVKAIVRQVHGDESILATFTTSVAPTQGKIKIYLSKESIDVFNFTILKYQIPSDYLQLNLNKLPARTYVWDLILTDPSGFKSRIIEGGVLVTSGVNI